MRATIATIDLDALEWNLSRVRARAGARAILGMVKANAYGHGMVEIARALVSLNVDILGTAFVDEAVVLRKNGIDHPILVLTPHERHEASAVVEYGLTTVVCDHSQAEALSQEAVRCGKVVSVHLYIDTGMLREGFRPHDALEASRYLRSLPGITLDGFCTHFATADEPDSLYFRHQLSTFEETLRELVNDGCSFASVHAANTGALWQSEASHCTLVRPGISIYGYAPAHSEEVRLRPVMSLGSRIVSLRRGWPGDTVSYGRRYMIAEETTIVTVPIGYGDGYLRSLSGSAWCLIRGRRCRIVGSICMDELMVDVGNMDVTIGDDVILLGWQTSPLGTTESIDAVELADWAGTIPYEITTAVSARVPRRYVGRLAAFVTNSQED